jgi:hypothetical protein
MVRRSSITKPNKTYFISNYKSLARTFVLTNLKYLGVPAETFFNPICGQMAETPNMFVGQ